MNPLSPAPLFRFALAGLLFLGPATARAQQRPEYDRTFLLIAREDSLETAQALLRDQALQDRWKAEDPEGYRKAFASAAELKDIGDLLMGKSQPRAIRLGLDKRPDCKFCGSPARLETWFKKEMPWADDSRVKALREATWAWEFVPPAAKKILAAKPVTEAQWEKLDFPERMDRLQEWSGSELAAILATTPRTPAEFKALEQRALAIGGIVGNSDSSRLWERVNHARQAVDGLARAEKLVGKDPAKRKALEAARGADLDDMLAGLGGIFDGAGVKDPAFQAAAPAREGQRFDVDGRRELVAGLLRTGLMKETEGTFAGRDLEEFYRTNKLDLKVAAPLKGQENWIGWHQGGVITFNEKHIQEYLKAEGRDVKDLAQDPQLLRRLSVQLAPLFVHEANHQRQMVWARENKLPWMPGQHNELETMQVEALFIVEKRRRDPSFDALIERDRKTSILARESAMKSERLLQGTQIFRDGINAWHYPELRSLEGTAWCSIKWHRGMAEDLDAELARRATLPKAERDRLAAGGAFSERISSEEDWKKSLREAGTPHLKASLAVHRGEEENIPATYAAYRRRLETINAQTAERLKLVLDDKNPTVPAAKRIGVPPPPGADQEPR